MKTASGTLRPAYRFSPGIPGTGKRCRGRTPGATNRPHLSLQRLDIPIRRGLQAPIEPTCPAICFDLFPDILLPCRCTRWKNDPPKGKSLVRLRMPEFTAPPGINLVDPFQIVYHFIGGSERIIVSPVIEVPKGGVKRDPTTAVPLCTARTGEQSECPGVSMGGEPAGSCPRRGC